MAAAAAGPSAGAAADRGVVDWIVNEMRALRCRVESLEGRLERPAVWRSTLRGRSVSAAVAVQAWVRGSAARNEARRLRAARAAGLRLRGLVAAARERLPAVREATQQAQLRTLAQAEKLAAASQLEARQTVAEHAAAAAQAAARMAAAEAAAALMAAEEAEAKVKLARVAARKAEAEAAPVAPGWCGAVAAPSQAERPALAEVTPARRDRAVQPGTGGAASSELNRKCRQLIKDAKEDLGL